jgi:cellulose 1,4-beta-cellobiosidase
MLRLACVAPLVAAAAATNGSNPFAGRTFYVNPSYQAELDSSIATATGAVKRTLMAMRTVPSAYWIDRKAKVRGNSTETLEGILADAAAQPTPPMVVFILYDLPNRDCDAKASNGEICCYALPDGRCDYSKAGDCAEGLAEYKQEYVDPFAQVVGRYAARVPVAIVIEPDSLGNLATNLDNPHCGNSATQAAYKEGIAYAVQTVAAHAPAASLYMDAGHGGWLGWLNNAQKYAQTIADLKVAPLVRGFSSNVANYQAVGTAACPAYAFVKGLPTYCTANATDPCCSDPCGLLKQYNFGNTELNYVTMMTGELKKAISPDFDPHWLIDTGRNGVADERKDCSNWCNIRNAGVGLRPTVRTPLPELVDAFFWLKTPGESDGCTQELPDGSKCARFDSMCSSVDSIGSQAGEPRCPEAGLWFDYQIKQLAANAHMDPPVARARAKQTSEQVATPFGPCSTEGAPCATGYTCEHGANGHTCMPTKARVMEAGAHSVFQTAYKHALQRAGRHEGAVQSH